MLQKISNKQGQNPELSAIKPESPKEMEKHLHIQNIRLRHRVDVHLHPVHPHDSNLNSDSANCAVVLGRGGGVLDFGHVD